MLSRVRSVRRPCPLLADVLRSHSRGHESCSHSQVSELLDAVHQDRRLQPHHLRSSSPFRFLRRC